MLSLKFEKALIHYVGNENYEEPMTTTGKMVHDRLKHCQFVFHRHILFQNIKYFFCSSSKFRRSVHSAFSSFSKAWRQLSSFPRVSDHSAHRGHIPQASIGFTKSKTNVDDETPVGTGFLALEYAVEHKILETPILDLSYYADVVGDVPPQQEQVRSEESESFNFGNGDFPPEWGVDIVVRGGFFRYGPWADRQRYVV
jgi:hypothetical protein